MVNVCQRIQFTWLPYSDRVLSCQHFTAVRRPVPNVLVFRYLILMRDDQQFLSSNHLLSHAPDEPLVDRLSPSASILEENKAHHAFTACRDLYTSGNEEVGRLYNAHCEKALVMGTLQSP